MKGERETISLSDLEITRMFEEVCQNLDLDVAEAKEEVKNLVMYEMTDGTRTSTNLKGWEAYYDGGIFCLRLIHLFKVLGGRNLYINVIHSRHKQRVNYQDIYRGLKELAKAYQHYTEITGQEVEWKFVGDYSESLAPAKAESPDLREYLEDFERLTEGSQGLTAIFMLNYSTKWLADQGYQGWEELPEANVIVRHCKGYVNGDMWLYDKLDDNSFMYVQNGSASKNWSDKQLLYLIALALRSYLINQGTHYSKSYQKGEKRKIHVQREEQLSIIHRQLEDPASKRVIIFSPIGPEIYEF